MEAVLSPSAPAEATVAEDPRDDLLAILKKGNGMYGGPFNSAKYTFCQCCGSQYVTADGKVGLAGLGGFFPVGDEGLAAYFEKSYGPQWAERINCPRDENGKVRWNADYDKRYRRINKPGVTCAFMSLEDAINLLFTEDQRHLAEGYEIHDEDQGGVVSILWMNA